MKLHDAISDGEGSEVEQRKQYFEGIGAYEVDQLPLPSRVGRAIYRRFEKALAWFVLRKYLFRFTDTRSNHYRNVEKNVKDAYRWLAETYRKGDQVYLFGASKFAANSDR
jgi:uncharacterized protein (DUF2235 family)